MPYAWSAIRGTDGSVRVGEEVDASKLGLSQEQYDELVSIGAIRDQKYPVPEGSDMSVVDYYRDQANQAAVMPDLDLTNVALPFATTPQAQRQASLAMQSAEGVDEEGAPSTEEAEASAQLNPAAAAVQGKETTQTPATPTDQQGQSNQQSENK